jgi:hypothetical protein
LTTSGIETSETTSKLGSAISLSFAQSPTTRVPFGGTRSKSERGRFFAGSIFVNVNVVRFSSASRTTRRFSSPDGVASADDGLQLRLAARRERQLEEALPVRLHDGREPVEDLRRRLQEEEREPLLLRGRERLPHHLPVGGDVLVGRPAVERVELPLRSVVVEAEEVGAWIVRCRSPARRLGSPTARSSGRT